VISSGVCAKRTRCGAPRIHGELLKLGFEIAESTVSTYMIRRRRPPSQNWRTFLRNHADAIAAIDLCVVPTVTFELLFAFVVLGHGRRQLLWFAVTRHPTAEWLAQQIVEAFPWNVAPAYLVRDNDGAYGQPFRRRIRSMGILDRPTSPRSPWQNAYAERLIGTLRRECLDHVLIFGVQHLRQILTSYSSLSLSETPYSWRTGANRVMLLPDGPAAQIALWCAQFARPDLQSVAATRCC
jgi:transposase InsO family protein